MNRSQPRSRSGRFTVHIAAEDHVRLAELAEQNHLHLNVLVAEAIRNFLQRAESKDGVVLRIRPQKAVRHG